MLIRLGTEKAVSSQSPEKTIRHMASNGYASTLKII
jgi:hypothetical protein